MNVHSRARFTVVVATLVLCVVISGGLPLQLGQSSQPDQISDPEFWRMITAFSEPSGPYTGDNWISNEASIQDVIPPLKQLTKPGGIYLGVGPEQNFTYMWALQSKMGFIIDIRRQNMLTILLHKALFEMSQDRADYVANLFSRRRPAGLDTNTNAKALTAAFSSAPSEGLAKNVQAVKDVLAKHGYSLSAEDIARIAFIQETFNRAGLSITAEYASPGSPGGIPVTFTDLMTATDKNGQSWSFLSSEAAYRYIRELHRKNLIVPIVGDFAGSTAIRSVGEYLKQRNSNVTVFYLSNVEYYLQGPTMRAFQSNLAALPIDSTSMLIRWSPRPTIPSVPWYTLDMGPVVSMLSPISELVDLYKANKAPTNFSEVLRGTVDPALLANYQQNPSLRRVTGRVTGITGLKPNELLRVSLVENLRPAGLILNADVAADGSFEVRNVSSQTYQAIVLRTCRGCSTSRVASTAVNVVVADKDVSDLRLQFTAQK
jgi:hypothetical protein